ncbi:Cell adhesion molecule 2 [Orchesella cincta]|uniref:Cell adhesion molecule 2 n=1 Tax=Orchesella cincta TaxID=48709 RepID=A0A1D2NJI1_ORCCI|nr:Cell adhesion molecule 2 [Orchesella cincta]
MKPLVIGLKLETVSIPQYGVKDGSAVLGCEFLLESDTLLVLKWYKDGHEFYRYTPQVKPNTLTFPVDGVYVDTAASDFNKVSLRNITLSTGGTYKCEVSADRPSFRTLSQQGDMFIIEPEISGIHPAVSVGDTITGNCTSYHTKPAASLMFYINEEKAETEYIIEYLPIPEPSGLETSVLGLNFHLEPRHFRNGAMELKCTATIGNGYWVKRMVVAEANINAQPSIPGHNRLLSVWSNISIIE